MQWLFIFEEDERGKAYTPLAGRVEWPLTLSAGRRHCPQVMVDVGFRAVGSAHWNSALSSKAAVGQTHTFTNEG
jgi:hypothetical protein